jgi:hypothetical protein
LHWTNRAIAALRFEIILSEKCELILSWDDLQMSAADLVLSSKDQLGALRVIRDLHEGPYAFSDPFMQRSVFSAAADNLFADVAT